MYEARAFYLYIFKIDNWATFISYSIFSTKQKGYNRQNNFILCFYFCFVKQLLEHTGTRSPSQMASTHSTDNYNAKYDWFLI